MEGGRSRGIPETPEEEVKQYTEPPISLNPSRCKLILLQETLGILSTSTLTSPPHPEATRFSQEISFIFPSQADIDACEAVEWELEKCVEGDVWNMGWQMRVGEKKVISVFDYTRQTWVPTNIPLPIVAQGIPIKFETEHILSHDREEHTALWINGTRYEQQFSHPMIPQRWPNGSTYLHYSFQLDSKGKGVPFTVKVDIGPTEVL